MHIQLWGIAVTSSDIKLAAPLAVRSRAATAACTVQVTITLENNGTTASRPVNVSVMLSGDLAVAVAQAPSLPMGATRTVSVSMPVSSIALWSPENPQLHSATIATSAGEQKTVVFGVKLITFSAAGLTLNGAPIKLRGGCVHHDNGPLGSMAIGRAEERRLELLKSVGYNAVRTSQ